MIVPFFPENNYCTGICQGERLPIRNVAHVQKYEIGVEF